MLFFKRAFTLSNSSQQTLLMQEVTKAVETRYQEKYDPYINSYGLQLIYLIDIERQFELLLCFYSNYFVQINRKKPKLCIN